MVDVLVVAGIRLHSDAMAALLHQRARDRLRVTVGTVGSHELPAQARAADVLVLDTLEPDSLDVLCRAGAESGCGVVAVGVRDDERDVVALAEAGVIGFVDRETGIDALVECIENAARGEATCPPQVASALLRRVTHLARAEPPDTSTLTVRERQIVQLIGEDLSNKEIARRLCIEVATVKNHVHNVLEKLQVSRRGEAVARLRLVEGGRERRFDPPELHRRRDLTGPEGPGRSAPVP
jgi:two-component system, NarL family, nitrate/nitrite response regulator NarL